MPACRARRLGNSLLRFSSSRLIKSAPRRVIPTLAFGLIRSDVRDDIFLS